MLSWFGPSLSRASAWIAAVFKLAPIFGVPNSDLPTTHQWTLTAPRRAPLSPEVPGCAQVRGGRADLGAAVARCDSGRRARRRVALMQGRGAAHKLEGFACKSEVCSRRRVRSRFHRRKSRLTPTRTSQAVTVSDCCSVWRSCERPNWYSRDLDHEAAICRTCIGRHASSDILLRGGCARCVRRPRRGAH